MKSLLILLFPLVGYSQTYIFQLHGYRCTVQQQCVTAANQYLFSLSGFPPTDYNGQPMEIQMVYNAQNGSNTGSCGTVVDISPSGTASYSFNASGPVTMWLTDLENSCANERNSNFDFGSLTYSQCTLFPIQLSSIGISNDKLIWTTDWETNTDYYEVQAAFNQGTWQDEGRVKAAGNSSIPTNYSFDLNQPKQAKTGLFIGLGILVLSCIRKKAALIGMICIISCSKTTVTEPVIKPLIYWRIEEFDKGVDTAVWHSETVVLN